MKKEMLINVLQPEECRIAIIENGILEELYVERTSHESYTGNIYKGKIVNLEPAIQAAFVDFSVGRNGFLHVSDVEPQYYHRGQAPVDEADTVEGPGPGFPSGPRSREPRRDRDRDRGRDREERRRYRPEAPGEPPPTPLPPPPRAEDRFRDRDRERERPDRSMRGRRDRSEMPRRFGEGLVDDRDLPALPPPPAPTPSPIEQPAGDIQEPSHGHHEPEMTSWPEAVERDWELERERERQQLRDRVFRPEEPQDELPSKPSRPTDLFDPDLPPSRTQRTRIPPSSPPGHEAEMEERGRYRLEPDTDELSGLDMERAEPVEETPPTEPFAPREPRRGRGRGRPTGSHARHGAPRPLPSFEQEDLLSPENEAGREPPPTADEFPGEEAEPRFEEPPRRRGGRAAIRSRGGEPERPRPPGARPPGDEPAAPSAPDRYGRSQAEMYHDRPSEPIRPRPAEPAEPTRERPRPHARAGEPGYVPRRERLRSADQGPGAEAPGYGWPPRAGEEEPDVESREFLSPGDESFLEPGAAASPRSDMRDGKRRRRRRGRRRDRDQERPESELSPSAAADDYAESDEDLTTGPGFGDPFSRGLPAEELIAEDIEDLELEAVDDEELALEDEEAMVGGFRPEPVRVAEEEIDPELEQEIRKEIEEIEELEREMGLRGPVEARPRRGDEPARGGRPARGRGPVKPPIQEIFRRGDEVLVQVIKESIGTKGPTLSTYISIPGRYLVLMPGLNRVGVSRKIVDEGQRRKLREIMHELNPPRGLGFIVRTAGLERTKRELARDLAYLLRLWKVILRRIKRTRTPGPIYQESDMITRTIRDIFTSEIDTIWIDEPQAFERAQEFLRVVMPRFVNRIKLYDEKVPLFHKYGIEDEIAKIQRRHVPLPEGGSIVIDPTEALVAIDVNSGNFRVEDDAEKTAYEMNLRAAKEIARQLRLRDLGGVIVNDFIDMREERHRRGVERALREAIKRDRARTKVLRMSAFGLIEMTRQRIRPSLKRSIYEDCPHCAGAGVIKTAESMAIDVMRLLALASHRGDIRRINITVSPGVATYLNNRKRKEIAKIESESSMNILVSFKENVPAEHLQIECYDANSSELRIFPAPAPGQKRGH
jgi:ribonuclease E